MKELNRQPIVSIIIPVFNTEKYLADTIDSVLNQTYKKLEIILVDDGSTDNSGAICYEYAEKDGRLKVFHIPNGGVAKARNLGIEHASGDYIIFVDSDDIVHPRYVESLLELGMKNHTPLAKCRYVSETNCDLKSFLDTNYDLKNHSERIVTINEYRYQGYYSQSSCVCVLYSRALIQNNRFDISLRYGEDTVFFAEILNKARCFSYLDETLYWYRKNPLSATQVFTQRRYDEILARRKVIEVFKNESKDFVRECNAALARRSMVIFHDAIRANYSDKLFLHKVWQESFRVRKSYLTSHIVGTKMKMKFAFYVYSPRLAEIIMKKYMI